MYTQSYDMIVSGKLPCSAEEAAQFGGITMQVKYGNHDSEKHKAGFAKMKELVPPEFQKNKDIEKAIYKEHNILQGTTELNAKFRYLQLIRSLKSYGTSFFMVKEPANKALKKKAEFVLLGVTKQAVVRMAVDTKQTLTEWKLTQLRRWSATAKTFTLDFGDYKDSYYVVETLEGEDISRIIAGYIDILVKKRTQLSTLVADSNVEEKAIVQDYVKPQKSSNVAIVSNQATKQANHRDKNDVNYKEDVPTSGQTAENMEVLEDQSALLRAIRSGLETLAACVRDINMPMQLSAMSYDTSAAKWKLDTTDLNAEAASAHIANMLSSVSYVLQHANGKQDSMNYANVGIGLASIIASIGQISQSLRVLSSIADDEFQDELINSGQVLIDATCELMRELQPVVTGHKILTGIHNAAGVVATSCSKILLQIDQIQVSEISQSELIGAAAEVGVAVANLATIGNKISITVVESDMRDRLLEDIQRSVDVVTILGVATGILASVITIPISREQLIVIAVEARDKSAAISEYLEGMPLSDLHEQLNNAIFETEDALAYLVDKARHLDNSLDFEIGSYNCEIQIVGAKMIDNIDSREVLLGCAKDMTINGTRLAECIKILESQSIDEDLRLQLHDIAITIADMTTRMVTSAKDVITDFSNIESKNGLLDIVDDMREYTAKSCAPYVKAKLLKSLAQHFKSIISTSNILFTTSRQSALSNRYRESQVLLNKFAKDITLLLPSCIHILREYKKFPKDPILKIKLTQIAESVVLPFETFISAVDTALPNIGDLSNKQQLSYIVSLLIEDFQELKNILFEVEQCFDGNELNEAIDAVIKDTALYTANVPGRNIHYIETQLDNHAREFNVTIKEAMDQMSNHGKLAAKNTIIESISQFKKIKETIADLSEDDPKLKQTLLADSSSVGNRLSKLIDVVTTEGPVDDELDQVLAKTSDSIKILLSNLPRHKLISQATQSIQTLTKSLEHAPTSQSIIASSLKSIDIDSLDIKNFLIAAATDLNSTTQALAANSQINQNLVPGKIELMKSSFERLVEGSESVGQSDTNTELGVLIHAIGTNCYQFMHILQKGMLDGSNLDFRTNLANASQSVGFAVDALISSFSGSNIFLEQCSKILQVLNASSQELLGINNPRIKVQSYSEAQFLAASTIEDLRSKLNGILESLDASDLHRFIGEFYKSVTILANLILLGINASHLIANADALTQRAISPTVNQNICLINMKELKLRMTKVCMKGQNSNAIFDDSIAIANGSAILCRICRGAAENESIEENTRHIFTELSIDIASSASELVALIKLLAFDITDQRRDQCRQPISVFLSHIVKMEATIFLPKLAGKAAIPGRISLTLQSQMIEYCNAAIYESRSTVSVLQSASMDQKNDFSGLTTRRTISNVLTSAESICNILVSNFPGKLEFGAIKAKLDGLDRILLVSITKAEANEEFSGQADSEGFLHSLLGLSESSQALRKNLSADSQDATRQAEDVCERFDLVTQSCLGIVSTIDSEHRIIILTSVQEMGTSLQHYVNMIQNYLNDNNDFSLYRVEIEADIVQRKIDRITTEFQKLDDQNLEISKSSKKIETLAQSYMVISIDPSNQGLAKPHIASPQLANHVLEGGQKLIACLLNIKFDDEMEYYSTISASIAAIYENIGSNVAIAIKQAENEEIRDNLKKVVHDLGKDAINSMNSFQSKDGHRRPAEIIKARVLQATKDITLKISKIDSIICRYSTGITACQAVNASIVEMELELETSVMFAKAKQLNPVGDLESYRLHQDSLVQLTQKLSGLVGKFQDSGDLPQEALGTLVTSAGDIIREIQLKSTQAATSLTSAECDLQSEILASAKNIASAMRDLIDNTMIASRSTPGLHAEKMESSVGIQSLAINSFITLMGTVQDQTRNNIGAFQNTINALISADNILNSDEPALGTALPTEILQLSNQIAIDIAAIVSKIGCKPEEMVPALNQVKLDIENICRAGKAVIVNAPTEKAVESIRSISNVTKDCVQILQQILSGQDVTQSTVLQLQMHTNVVDITQAISGVVDATSALVPQGYVDIYDPNVIAERSLLSAADSIETAAKKVTPPSVKTSQKSSDFDVVIFEAIKRIAGCTAGLVRSATGVQRAIVSKGKAGGLKEGKTILFGAWSDGLVTSAQEVVADICELCDSASLFFKDPSEIDRVSMCSKRVASSSVRIMTAVAMKSDPKSDAHLGMRAANKAVADSTNQLIEKLKNHGLGEDVNGGETVKPVSAHKGKIMEMEAQMKILRLEKELEIARVALSSIRKVKYVNPDGPEQQVVVKTSPANVPREERLSSGYNSIIENYSQKYVSIPRPANPVFTKRNGFGASPKKV